MAFTTNVRTYLERLDDLRNPDLLWPFLADLAKLGEGFRLFDFYSENPFGPWHDILIDAETDAVAQLTEAQRNELFVPGLSPTLQAKTEQFLAGEEPVLVIDALSVARGGELWGLDYLMRVVAYDQSDIEREDSPQFKTLCASVTYKYLDTDGKRSLWEQLPLLIYRNWRPLFTCLNYEDDPRTSLEDAQAGRFRYLYKINIYSPRAVEHLGRAKLLATPDAKVEELEDGGVFLRPYDAKQVAAYLGMTAA
jgi:hypothetical protein